MSSRRVVLADLPLPEKERFYEFLVANKVEFVADNGGEAYVAMIRVVPPEPTTARITGRVRQASKSKKAASADPSKARSQTSTSVAAPSQDAATTLKAAQSVLRRRYTRFCNLLPTLTQPPKALRRISLIRFADEVYDARYEKDSAFIKNEASGEGLAKLPQTFPDFVYEFAAKRYGLKALVSTNCWGMVSSVELLRGQHAGIDLYGKFLEESYDATDLLFFLFARSAIERVMAQDQAATSAEAGEDKAKTKAKVKSVKSVAPVKMEAKQVYQVVKLAIDSKRQDLRDQVIKKLDGIMAARAEGSGRKAPTLEPERLLAVATEEYHNSRDLKEEPEEEIRPRKQMARGTAVTDGVEEDLTPEIRKEVRQVTSRLVASLSASGEKDVNPQEVYDWALHVTLRRHKIGDYLEQEREGLQVTMNMDEMQGAALTLIEQPGLGENLLASSDVLNLSPEDFERNLEDNVRQLLLNSTSELVTDAVSALPSKIWRDEQVAASMKSALISEFAPAADTLMEAIVGKDYRRWLDQLKIEGNGSLKHRQQFEKLHDEFQQVLSSDISAQVVQNICRTVVGAAELQDLVRNRALELSKLGKQKRLGESSSEDELDGDMQGTAKFGNES